MKKLILSLCFITLFASNVFANYTNDFVSKNSMIVELESGEEEIVENPFLAYESEDVQEFQVAAIPAAVLIAARAVISGTQYVRKSCKTYRKIRNSKYLGKRHPGNVSDWALIDEADWICASLR